MNQPETKTAPKSAFTVKETCYAGLFAAVIAIMAQISIPMPGGVPMTMQTFAVTLAAIVLGAKLSTVSTVIYLILGAAGVPVLAGFTGGLAKFVGPTGGFLISFPLMAFVIGWGVEHRGRSRVRSCRARRRHGAELCGRRCDVLRADAEHACSRHHGLCAAVHPDRHYQGDSRFGRWICSKKTPQLNTRAALPAIDAGRAAFCLPGCFKVGCTRIFPPARRKERTDSDCGSKVGDRVGF